MKLLRTLYQRWNKAVELDFSMNRQFLHSSSDHPRLRIGIASSNGQIPRYARQIIKDISASSFADVVCVIDSAHCRKNGWITYGHALFDTSWRHCLIYRSYQILSEPFHRRSSDPLETVSFDDLIPLDSITHIELSGKNESPSREIPDLDVILNLGAEELNEHCRKAARYGVWFYRLGEGCAQNNDAELVARVLADPASTARIMLELAAGPDIDTTILKEAFFAMTPTLSARENHFPPYWGSTHFVIEKLLELHNSGALGTLGQKPSPPVELPKPTNRQIISHQKNRLRRFTSRLPKTVREGQHYVHWNIALRYSQTPLLEEEENSALQEFHWLHSPPGHFWADPFLIEHEGDTWVFFEDFVLAEGKGKIACGRIGENADLVDVRVVLDKPYHLSYPQVFHHNGEIYLVPESVRHHCVDLFRATRFPYQWEHERQLLDVSVVDATLAEHDGRWWMFASPMPIPGHAPMTYLWSAKTLTGKWLLASPNAVSHDVSHSRGAGSVYIHNSSRYRISQDGSTAYGGALWFNEIEQWNDKGYHESPRRRIEGHGVPGLTGIHSYNRAGCWEVIDGRFVKTARARQNTNASCAVITSPESPLPPSPSS